MAGFLLVVDGSPFIFSTVSVTNVLVGPSDWPEGAGLIPGSLDWPDFTITEETSLLTGEVEVGSIAPKLHDLLYDFGGSVGRKNLVTWLTTRDEESLPSTELTASLIAAGSFFVANPTAIAAYIPGVVWIDEEAIFCSAINVGTGEVTITTRAYLGTVQNDHLVEPELNLYPTAWAQFPWVGQRRCRLFYATSDGAVSVGSLFCLWIGYTDRPRLASDGVRHEFQCEHHSKRDLQRVLGQVDAVCALRGFNASLIKLWVRFDAATERQAASPDTVHNSLGIAVNAAALSLDTRLDADEGGGRTFDPIQIGVDREALTASLTGGGLSALLIGLQLAYAAWAVDTVNRTGGGGSLTVALRAQTLPAALVRADRFHTHIPITRTDRLSNVGAASYNIAPYGMSFTSVLRGLHNSGDVLVLSPLSSTPVTADDATIGGGPSYIASSRWEKAVDAEALAPEHVGLGRGVVQDALPLRQIVSVGTQHWAVAWRFILDTAGELAMKHGIDTRNWDWSRVDYLIAATAGPIAGRTYTFDDGQTVADVLLPELVANACALAPGSDGRLRIVAIQAPTSQTEVDTVTEDDLVAGEHATWERWEEGLVNRVSLSADAIKVVVQDTRSIKRYGQGREIAAELTGLDNPRYLLEHPVQLADTLFARFFALYGRPRAVVRLPVTWRFFQTHVLTWVSFSEWLVPNGAGGRGATDRLGLVIGAERVIGRATVWLKLLVVPSGDPIAPCVRLASIVADQLRVAVDYIGGTSDYAVSEASTSPRGTHGGVVNDGGAGFFGVGMRVQLVLRDVTTTTTYEGIVASTNPSGGPPTITLTAPVPTVPTDWPTEAAAGRVDVRFSPYATAGILDEQTDDWAWVGSDATQVIAGTADAVRAWMA